MGYDLVLKNADVIAMDHADSRYNWIAVQGQHITALGTGTHPPEAKYSIDLEGKTVLPGLADCHVHVLQAGVQMTAMNLAEIKSIKELLCLLEEYCLKSTEEWVIGMDFVPQNIKECRYPDRWELDKYSHGHKVMILAATLHGLAVNSAGMDSIDVPTDLAGVEMTNGIPKGVYLSDTAAFLGMGNMFASMKEEKLWEYIETCVNYAVSKGVTLMHGLFGQMVTGDKDVDLILKYKQKLPLTMVEYYQTWDVDKVKKIGWPRIGGCLTLDGALFEYTMANFEPYVDEPSKRGLLLHSDEEVYNFIKKANQSQMQCALHAVGDRAIDQLIYVYRQILMEEGDSGLRHRIEHFCEATQEQIELAAELGLILSMQPGVRSEWDNQDGGTFSLSLGKERAGNWNPLPKIIDAGGVICSGSDAPILSIDPIRDLIFAVDHANPVRNICLKDALTALTKNAAFAAHLENEKGTIEVGKDADFAILNKNPYETLGTRAFHELQVDMTIHKGTIVFERQN